MLTAGDIDDLTRIRRDLHRMPEVSRHEAATALAIRGRLAPLAPDSIIHSLGGHGVAAVFDGEGPGPTVLFRAELDALPIQERSTAAHRSTIDGAAHLCGHEGHMTILLGLGRLLSQKRPAQGRVILMFQPAEEDGSGAAAVTADPEFAALTPDFAFAIHNMPGLGLGLAKLAAGVVNCASVGLRLRLSGRTAHASQPETGLSPAGALTDLMLALPALGRGGPIGPDYRLVTLTHARLGEATFGVAPGEAVIHATLRCPMDAPMAALKAAALDLAQRTARSHHLDLAHDWLDDFAASVNHPDATDIAARALARLAIPNDASDLPMRASEDFGRFGHAPTKGAMIFLGAGNIAALHNPDYDFPDTLIGPGVAIFHQIAVDILG